MIKLKPRLFEIASFLLPPKAECMPLAVCDVGTDHGYIPIYLVQNGVKHAIASDVSRGSADKAAENVKKYGLQEQIDVRVGDGLSILSDYEADTIIIAGMGGILISEILARGVPKGVKRMILQPMRAAFELRKWIAENGYRMIDESLVVEGKKLYNILLVEQGQEVNTKELDYLIGAKLVQKRHPLLPDYIEQEYKRISKRIDGLLSSNREADTTLLCLQRELEGLKEMEDKQG